MSPRTQRGITSWKKGVKHFKQTTKSIVIVGLFPTPGFDLYSMRATLRLLVCRIGLRHHGESHKHRIHGFPTHLPPPHKHLPQSILCVPPQGGAEESNAWKVTPYWITAKAALFRTAVKTCKRCRPELNALQSCRDVLGLRVRSATTVASNTASTPARRDNSWTEPPMPSLLPRSRHMLRQRTQDRHYLARSDPHRQILSTNANLSPTPKEPLY